MLKTCTLRCPTVFVAWPENICKKRWKREHGAIANMPFSACESSELCSTSGFWININKCNNCAPPLNASGMSWSELFWAFCLFEWLWEKFLFPHFFKVQVKYFVEIYHNKKTNQIKSTSVLYSNQCLERINLFISCIVDTRDKYLLRDGI